MCVYRFFFKQKTADEITTLLGFRRGLFRSPANTPPAKADALRAWGAGVVSEGAVGDDANAAALESARRDGLSYVHPFADPLVIAGQGTVGLEIVEQMERVDTVVVAIGGGGLISGVATATKALRPAARASGVEP
mgnify:CR=1 FL=1